MNTIKAHGHRLLKNQEIEDIYSLPKLNELERHEIFHLTDREMEVFYSLHTPNSKFVFVFQLGFFKAKKRFYTLSELEKDEASKRYIMEKYFKDTEASDLSLKVTNPTRLSHQTHILKFFGYRRCKGNISLLFKEEVSRLSRMHANPTYIVREVLRFLEREKIVIPAYSTLQDVIGMSVQLEINKAGKKLDSMLNESQKKMLDSLCEKQENFLHELTLLKRDPKDFSLKEIKKTIKKREKLDVFHKCVDMDYFCTEIKISKKNFLEYARLVNYYKTDQVSRMNPLTKRFLIFCFIRIRYQMINDHLVKAFIYRIDKYVNDARNIVIQETYHTRIAQNKNLKKAGKLLDLFLDQVYLPDDIPFKKVRDRAFSILNEKDIAILAKSLKERSQNEKSLQWEQFDKMGTSIRRNLRPLVLALKFDGQPSFLPLIREIDLLKNKLKRGVARTIKSNPDLFSKSKNRYIYEKRDVVHLRYEFELYRKIADKLNSGDLFIIDSILHRSFDQDLIDKKSWKKKAAIIASLGLPKLKECPQVLLKNLDQELSLLYKDVNDRVIRAENTYIKVNTKHHDRWTLPYTKAKEFSRIDIFGHMPAIGLSTLLNIVNRHTGFTDAFTHILSRYTKKEKSLSALLATITACATNIGLNKMARNANISAREIEQTYLNFIRPETLKLACDMIADKMVTLPSFFGYNIDNERIYSSSDGQKFGVSRNTANARYSPKYFGLEKGVVSYTLKANYVPINSRIIGANEHESHFVLDILLGNTSEIKPDIHTTDSHGINRVNFALLYLFDYVFAPRYKQFEKEARNIYCVSYIDKYKDYPLRPKGIINTDLIIQEWDNILRVVASLATKTTSQSTIVRKLSAYRRKNNTGKALEELNRIIKSIHILRYIDEVDFRQHIQKALNRGESYHSLKKAIFYDNDRKFRVSSEVEQNTWTECTRLMALSIIYYNSFLLSKIVSRCMKQGKKADFLKEVFPIQWKHIDMYGHFYFGDSPNESELNSVLSAIEGLDFTLFS